MTATSATGTLSTGNTFGTVRERHKAEKRAKDGELYWYGINRAADATAKVLASVLRIKHEHV